MGATPAPGFKRFSILVSLATILASVGGSAAAVMFLQANSNTNTNTNKAVAVQGDVKLVNSHITIVLYIQFHANCDVHACALHRARNVETPIRSSPADPKLLNPVPKFQGSPNTTSVEIFTRLPTVEISIGHLKNIIISMLAAHRGVLFEVQDFLKLADSGEMLDTITFKNTKLIVEHTEWVSDLNCRANQSFLRIVLL